MIIIRSGNPPATAIKLHMLDATVVCDLESVQKLNNAVIIHLDGQRAIHTSFVLVEKINTHPELVPVQMVLPSEEN